MLFWPNEGNASFREAMAVRTAQLKRGSFNAGYLAPLWMDG